MELWGTYSGLIEGRPSPVLNACLLEQHVEHAQARMSHVPLRVVEPEVSASGALQPVACLAVLGSFTLAKEGDGDMLAHCKVLCFLDALPSGLLPGAVLDQVDWARDARNFDL